MAGMAPKKRIMVVEDEAIVALDIQNRLRGMGYDAELMAATGEEAVRLARKAQPDLILMDVMLGPGIDGIEAAAKIREDVHLPVVFVTAYADDSTLDRAKGTGPFGYIIKPFDDRELRMSVEMALYKHGVERRLEDNERFLETILDSISDAVVTTDPEGRVAFMNPAAEALLGMAGGDVVGEPVAEVLRVVDADTGVALVDPVEGLVLTSGPREPADTLLLTAHGRRVPVSASAAPLRGADGESAGAVVVYRDASRHKRAERQLQHSVERLRTTLNEAVEALATLAEKRDPYTAGHQKRVARLACAMAERMGLDEETVQCLHVAGVLHDIGKISMPAEILSKPAALTPQEMGLMQSHPERGHDILRGVTFPWPVARTVLEHHERLDGSGYPQGLTGAAISTEARVLAVADVVEAMSSHRPYRPALGLEMALDEIRDGRGQTYDPEAVDACLALMQGGGFRFEEQ